jgi:hypothetical protein
MLGFIILFGLVAWFSVWVNSGNEEEKKKKLEKSWDTFCYGMKAAFFLALASVVHFCGNIFN